LSGSESGFAHRATADDFNRGGFLDISISDYGAEFSHEILSRIHWGNREARFSVADRRALYTGSPDNLLLETEVLPSDWTSSIPNSPISVTSVSASPLLYFTPRLAMISGVMFKLFKSTAEAEAAVLNGNRTRFVMNPKVFT